MTKASEKQIPKATRVIIDWKKSLSFQQYHTRDALDRTISFYVAKHASDDGDLPLVLYIQGSGATSVFQKNEMGFWCGTNYDVYLNPLKNRARLMVVEKPGVTLFDRGRGNAEDWPQDFLFEHTLERWTEAINSAIKSAQKTSGNKQEKITGHWSF